jgi:hypothetical protein
LYESPEHSDSSLLLLGEHGAFTGLGLSDDRVEIVSSSRDADGSIPIDP